MNLVDLDPEQREVAAGFFLNGQCKFQSAMRAMAGTG